MRETYQISEYSSFVREKEINGCTSLPPKVFDALESFILSNSSKETDALEIMSLTAKKGYGKLITAKNYVGVISMKDGTTIEILPKIYSQEQSNEQKVKSLLIAMLKTLKDSPFKSLQQTNVNIEKMNVFEIFIRMFVDEVYQIVKKGLRCNYESIQANETVFKGKMIFKRQIKSNYAHKERCFIEYDDYNVNRAENRLIKATLLYLQKITYSTKNKRDINTLLCSFTNINASENIEEDFIKVVMDRNAQDYNIAIRWCKVFLLGQSFTSFSGSEVAYALLFPMETLFESYVAAQLRKLCSVKDYSFITQDRSIYLFDEPRRKFLMKPDIVIKQKETSAYFIMDTKWKMLSEDKPNHGISQSDMYQMYAYHKKYGAQNVTILYPQTGKMQAENSIEYSAKDDVIVRIRFIDLFNTKKSLIALFEETTGVGDGEKTNF